jgi:catechol 2,3-dioxygenase-like lactoylglutathione lyase family enzyme
VRGLPACARHGDRDVRARPDRAPLRRHKINIEHADRPTPIHLCSITDAPLADSVEHLKACGVALRDGPVKRSGAEGPIDSIYLDDPDQNSIEVSTYPALSSA